MASVGEIVAALQQRFGVSDPALLLRGGFAPDANYSGPLNWLAESDPRAAQARKYQAGFEQHGIVGVDFSLLENTAKWNAGEANGPHGFSGAVIGLDSLQYSPEWGVYSTEAPQFRDNTGLNSKNGFVSLVGGVLDDEFLLPVLAVATAGAAAGSAFLGSAAASGTAASAAGTYAGIGGQQGAMLAAQTGAFGAVGEAATLASASYASAASTAGFLSQLYDAAGYAQKGLSLAQRIAGAGSPGAAGAFMEEGGLFAGVPTLPDMPVFPVQPDTTEGPIMGRVGAASIMPDATGGGVAGFLPLLLIGAAVLYIAKAK